MADKTPEKKTVAKDDPAIRTHYVMRGGERVPFKVRLASLDDILRREAAEAAERDAETVIAEHQKEQAKPK
jgi:hypothetical protein